MKPNDYHDYVIKDGRLVGNFEKMYQECDDPWNQSKDLVASYSKMSCICSLANLKLKDVLEVGCGFGYYTDLMSRMLPDTTITGLDISKTAVEKARSLFPKIQFLKGNISGNDFQWGGVYRYDGMIFAEVMWFLLKDFDMIRRRLRENFSGKYLLINQTFYYEGQQYGQDSFTTQDEMIDYVAFPVVYKIREDRADRKGSYCSHTVFKVI